MLQNIYNSFRSASGSSSDWFWPANGQFVNDPWGVDSPVQAKRERYTISLCIIYPIKTIDRGILGRNTHFASFDHFADLPVRATDGRHSRTKVDAIAVLAVRADYINVVCCLIRIIEQSGPVKHNDKTTRADAVYTQFE